MPIDRVRVNEESVKVVQFSIVDSDGTAVAASSLTVAALTLYDRDTYAEGASPAVGIINGRDDQNVLNNNNVTIDSSGVVIWTMQPEDNIVVTRRRQVERHVATFHFEWSTGEFNYPIEIEVVNL